MAGERMEDVRLMDHGGQGGWRSLVDCRCHQEGLQVWGQYGIFHVRRDTQVSGSSLSLARITSTDVFFLCSVGHCRYHFLLQSEPEVLSLDDYVLNTGEFRAISSPPPPSSPLSSNLGIRHKTSPSLFHRRHDVLIHHMKRGTPVPHQS